MAKSHLQPFLIFYTSAVAFLEAIRVNQQEISEFHLERVDSKPSFSCKNSQEEWLFGSIFHQLKDSSNFTQFQK
jgi:hypothetical protein